MNKFITIALLVAVVGTSVNGARLRNFRQSRFSARQELEEDVAAQTPYPPSGLKPDIPFGLPNEPQVPQQPQQPFQPIQPRTPLQPPLAQEPLEPEEPEEPEQPEDEPLKPQEPDNTYLPPDNLQPPAQTYGPPDQFYGPPEASGDGEASVDDAVEVLPGQQPADAQDEQNELIPVNPEAEVIENIQNGRIVLARNFRRQNVRQNIKPAKLRSAKLQVQPAAPLRSQRLVAQPLYATNGALVAYRFLRV